MTLRALWPLTQQFQNKNGSNLVSGKVYIYYQGRTALATTYHDEAGTVVNANPVLLDNNGRATVFADTIYSYTIVVCDYYGKELFSQDITLHDAIATAKDVIVMGSNGSVKVDKTELPNGVQYDLSVNTDIIATKKSVEEDLAGIETTIANKKDKQNELNFNGSATKTIKKITQYPNGELNVEFEDISAGGISSGDAIDLTNNTVSVKYSKGLEVNSTNQLQVKVGAGLTFDGNSNIISSFGNGIYLTPDGKLTTEEPEENFIDITNEWEFVDDFRLQYNGEFPGFGNDMHILYSPVSDTVKFTSSCRINNTSPLKYNNEGWYIMLRYTGNRFYTTYDTNNANLTPSIGQYPTLGGISLTVGTNNAGTSNNSFLKLAYVGSPSSDISQVGLGVKIAINDSSSSTYGCILHNLVMKVHKKV